MYHYIRGFVLKDIDDQRHLCLLDRIRAEQVLGDEDEHFLAVATTAVAAEAAPQTRLSSSAVLLSVGLDNSPIFSDFSPKPHKYLSSFIALAF